MTLVMAASLSCRPERSLAPSFLPMAVCPLPSGPWQLAHFATKRALASAACAGAARPRAMQDARARVTRFIVSPCEVDVGSLYGGRRRGRGLFRPRLGLERAGHDGHGDLHEHREDEEP